MSNKILVDYDFTKDPRYVKGFNGYGPRGLYAKYADTAPVIPESDWKELSQQGGCSRLVTRIYNQKQEGSCVANASCQSHEITQARQFGKDRVVHLSAISLYKRIGSSPNSGAMVSSGIDEMVENGVLPLTRPENSRYKHTMENTGFHTSYPEGWQETAKLFKALEWTEIDSYAELVSCLLLQFPVVVGRSGHSICYCDFLYKDGEPMVRYANSWGDWGENGYGYDTLRSIKASSGWAYAPRSVVYPSY